MKKHYPRLRKVKFVTTKLGETTHQVDTQGIWYRDFALAKTILKKPGLCCNVSMAGLCPDGIIRFSDNEAAQLSRFIQELDEEDDAEIAEPEV